jgi:hypothetical protein
MLGHDQTYRRQVEHLAPLLTSRLAVGQITTATLTDGRHVQDHLVGLLDALKMTTLMAGLAARLAARPAPQTLGCRWLRQPVRRRGPRRITRILRQTTLQLGNLSAQLGDQRRLLDDKRLQSIPRHPTRHKTTFETPLLPPPTT